MSLPSSSMVRAEMYSDSTSPVSQDSSVFFNETTASCIKDPLDFFIINVGGSRYMLSQELLASHPETRLGRLACCSRDSALELCDDADFLENEFFFDRNSQTFQYVMNYYQTGHLHVREELCEISFLQEIEYWGIDELRINPCCRERYYRRKEQKENLDVRRAYEPEDNDEDFVGAACPALRRCLWDLLEKPESSRAARTFGSLSVFFVILSVINMVLISLDLGEDFGMSDVGFGLKSLGLTIAECYEEVGLLLLFLGVGISIFATVVFTLERDLPATTFTSVPAAWWWATTSMTTVGYGDIRPDTAVGKVLAFLCILSGILILALPIAIINERFSACYFTMKVKDAAMRQSEMLKRLARGSVGGMGEGGVGGGVNLRDAYARSILEMLRLHGAERVSTRSSGGEEMWW
ncbi:potassium voltage-gated channel subfamily V member 1 [Sander vitreus]